MSKSFGRNLNEVIVFAEINVTFKLTSISANEIASFRFPRKVSFKRKLFIRLIIVILISYNHKKIDFNALEMQE